MILFQRSTRERLSNSLLLVTKRNFMSYISLKTLNLLFIFLSLFTSCTSAELKQTATSENEPQHVDSPYVLLISIDGYRYDYNKIHKPKFLNEFAKDSARLDSLVPTFPTKTFPNHLSIATGMYPMNHGIVANHFYNPELRKRYSLKDRSSVTNPQFYKGIPLWSLAESQGMRSATYFWPGSEAKIAGKFPSQYMIYNHGTPHEKRINKVKEWLSLDKSKRPHFMTLYFHDVDSAGHKYGPKSSQAKKAVQKVDKSLRELYSFIKTLSYPVNVIIVSDHGMHKVNKENIVDLSKKDKSLFDKFLLEGSGPLVHLYKKDKTSQKDINKTLQNLNNGKGYKCYPNAKTPKKLNFRNNPSIGDIVCIAQMKSYLTSGITLAPTGAHGWSQFEGKKMHGIFYAKGPCFKKNKLLKSQSNIHIYPMIAKILKLDINHKIDGHLSKMKELITKECL